MATKLPVKEVLTEGVALGLKNFVSLLGATVLYVLTCWIPYLNVGTTIAMKSIPVELSKGNVINPLFIFDAKYRKSMGEYFILVGLMAMAMVPAAFLGIIPAIVLSFAWSLSIYLFIDKGLTSLEALRESNRLTYGYKWKIFFIELIVGICVCVLTSIIAGICGAIGIDSVGAVLNFIIMLLIVPIMLGVDAIIYNNLTKEEAEPAAEAAPEAAPAE